MKTHSAQQKRISHAHAVAIAQALAILQAQQSAQAQSASANWAENQAMQADANQMVMTHVTQSQANKDYWAAFVIWQKKVADAMARIREEELARKRAEVEARAKQIMYKLLALGISVTLAFVLLSLSPHPQKTKYDEYTKPTEIASTACLKAFPAPLLSQILCILSLGGSTIQTTTPSAFAQMSVEIAITSISAYLNGIFADKKATQAEIDWLFGLYLYGLSTDAVSSNSAEQDDDNITYYFRGTTRNREGVPYEGNPNTLTLGVTSTTTQPGVATVFATVAQTELGGTGVVYIFSSNSLANVPGGGGNVLSESEFEVGFNILPTEIVQYAVITITASDARNILEIMGFSPMDTRIRLNDQNSVLQTLRPLSKAEIALFVTLAGVRSIIP